MIHGPPDQDRTIGPVRMLAAIGAVVLVVGVGGCTKSQTASPAPVTDTVTLTRSPPTVSVVPTGPLDARPLSRADGLCPFLTESAAVTAVGMRMDRQAIISRGGKAVGCDFYADQAWAQSEHLPGPNQPVLEILSTRYASATIAYNAMVLASRAGTSAHQANLGNGQIGVSYRTQFDPADGGTDWAYVFSVGTLLITVLTAQNSSELNPREVASDLDPTKF